MQLVRQVSSLLAVRWVLLGLSFVTGIFVARTLGPDGKGVLTLVAALVNMMVIVAGFGLPTAAVYLHKKKRYSIGELAGSSLPLYVLVVIGFALLLFGQSSAWLNLFVGASGEFDWQPIWLWLSLGTLLGVLLSSFCHNIFVTDNRMRLYTLLNVGSQLVSVALMWTLVIGFGFGITGALAAMFGAQVFGSIVVLSWLRSLGKHGQLRLSWRALRDLLRSGAGPYAAGFIAGIFKRGEAVLLAFLLDIRFVGYYGVALTFYELMVDIPRAVVWPMVGRLADPDNPRAIEIANRNIRLQVAVMALPVIGLALVAPFLVPLAYGQAFEPAGVLLAGMLPGVLFRTVHLGVTAYFISVGRMETTVPGVTTAAVVNLGLDLLLVPRFGLTGVAISNVTAELLMALISVFVFLRATRGHWADVFPPRRSDLDFLYQTAGSVLSRVSRRVNLRFQ